MARRKKDLEPIDREAQRILNDTVENSGKSHADIAAATGMSQNRVSIILRRDTPPASVGEIMAIAHAVGLSGSVIIAQAEEALNPLATVTDLSERALSVIEERSAALNPGYDPEEEHGPETP